MVSSIKPLTPNALPHEELHALAERGVVRTYSRNAIIVSEGDQTDALYIIVCGRIKVFVADAEGKELILGHQGPGEYFGEMTLDGGPRSASVQAVESCRVVVVPRAELQQFLAQHPGFAIHLIGTLIRRVRALTEHARSLALMDVYGRVARLLLELAAPGDGALVVSERLTQQDIAARIGASREMVSRVFKDLVSGGYIRIQRKSITICKHLPQHW